MGPQGQRVACNVAPPWGEGAPGPCHNTGTTAKCPLQGFAEVRATEEAQAEVAACAPGLPVAALRLSAWLPGLVSPIVCLSPQIWCLNCPWDRQSCPGQADHVICRRGISVSPQPSANRRKVCRNQIQEAQADTDVFCSSLHPCPEPGGLPISL